MIDFTHKKRPDFIQLVLIIAIACLALGAISPVSAIEYDDISFQSGGGMGAISGTIDITDRKLHEISNALPGGISLYCRETYYQYGAQYPGHYGTLTQFINNPGIYTDLPYSSPSALYHYAYFVLYSDIGVSDLSSSEKDVYVRLIADFLLNNTDLPPTTYYARSYDYEPPSHPGDNAILLSAYPGTPYYYQSFNYSYDPFYPVGLNLSLTAFAPDDPSGMYVLSLDGSLLDTTYTVGVNRYTSEFEYLVDSYAYTDGSGSYTFTGSRSLTLPIYYNSFTNMPYSYELSVNVNDENGYLDARYPVYWSNLGGLYDSAPSPVLPTPIPTPTQTFIPTLPVNPSDIIPDPESLNDTVNITGWYQDSGFEGNNITAPIYNGIRGWFNENLAPVIDFFLTPTNYVATVIYDSAETSTDGISYITEELGSYAAPFNTVGAYVVRLVPEVVWLVVFAALSIGYVVLLIKISTGSIRDTIGRFLGGSK